MHKILVDESVKMDQVLLFPEICGKKVKLV